MSIEEVNILRDDIKQITNQLCSLSIKGWRLQEKSER